VLIFVRQKDVPGSIERNRGSLSKIIGSFVFLSLCYLIASHRFQLGNCWRALPLEEKHVWEVRAKHAKADQKIQYPEYKFCPVHNKNKDKTKEEKAPLMVEDERQCEEVVQLLLEGKKEGELAAAFRDLDSRSSVREETPAGCLDTNNNNTSSRSMCTGGCRAFHCRTTIILCSAV